MLIHKQTLEMEDKQTLILPAHANILTVQVQNGKPQIWYSFDERQLKKEDRIFLIIGTGNPSALHQTDKYVSTFQLGGGVLIFHVFETLY